MRKPGEESEKKDENPNGGGSTNDLKKTYDPNDDGHVSTISLESKL